MSIKMSLVGVGIIRHVRRKLWMLLEPLFSGLG